MREVKPTQKPVPSSDIKDLFFNSGLLDIWATSLERKYIDRFGNCHLTAAGMEWLFKELIEKFKVDMNTAIVAAGYITIDSFQQGADLPNNELTQRNHILRDETTGEYYRWDGDLPKQVPAGSIPQSTGGIGKGAWISVGDASLRGDLTSENGILLISKAIIECDTVSIAKNIAGMNEGRKVRTYKHNVDVVSEWIYTKQKPTGNEFYIDAIDGYLILLTPNFASAGVKSGDYSPESAWHNRNTIMRLMRDSRFNKFSFGGVGKFYILGSVIPNRNNITLEIEEGVEVVGRYDDPSIPESTEFQRGEMFGFPICSSYDAGNLDVTDDVNDITVIINGSASTEYNEIHSRKNNNNVIGFIRSNNCVVKGNGGIDSSDHKGVCFDGDAVNCHIDLAYILNTKNEPLQMKGKFSAGIRNKCTSRVGRIETTFGGGNPRVVAFVSGCSHDVTIDKFDYYSESSQPVLVGAFGAHSVNVKLGEVGGASQLVRMYNTNKVRLSADVVSKTPSLVVRAGDELNTAHDVVIENIKAVDNVLTSAYAEEAGIQGATRFVTINNCDFFPASTSFKYLAAVINPISKSIYNNTSRSGMNIVEYNPIIGRQSRNVITAGARTFIYDAALPDFNYSSINLLVRNSSGATYSLDVNIKARLDSGVSGATFSVGGVIVDTVLSGLKMTISTTTEGASFTACTPFN